MIENRQDGGLVLRWGHLIIAFVVQMLLIGALFGRLLFQVEDNTRRIEKLEDAHYIPGSQSVSKDQFEQMKEDLMRRLKTMEDMLNTVIDTLVNDEPPKRGRRSRRAEAAP